MRRENGEERRDQTKDNGRNMRREDREWKRIYKNRSVAFEFHHR